MTTTPFTDGWEFSRSPEDGWAAVALPHDAMLSAGRSADNPAGAHQAYFRGGRYRYRRTWSAPADLAGRRVSLVFEGVYRRSEVFLNGCRLAAHAHGSTAFEVELTEHLVPGEDNLVEVTVDNSAQPSARWYTGGGIDRPVRLRVVDPVHVVRDGVHLRTISIEGQAVVHVDVELADPGGAPVEVAVSLGRPGTTPVRAAVTTGTGTAHLELVVPEPVLWSAETPELYDLQVALRVGGVTRDEVGLPVGLRTVALDPARGLLVNGEVTLLRGANLHHDHGILGTATFAAAERRRVRTLKEAGYNAVRSAHGPASRALLDACDELGMYVIDELYDNWYDHKTDEDDADLFDSGWQDVADAVVRQGRSRPSVVLYSIGNENSELGSWHGLEAARRLAGHVRSLDPDRPVTAGVNLVSALGWPVRREGSGARPPAKRAPAMNSTAINLISNHFGRITRVLSGMRRIGRSTAEVFAVLDVAGYNYGSVRYEQDVRDFPDRLVVGTESMPIDLVTNWELVERLPAVIGDFVWAGWEYLGECGIGSWVHGTKRAAFQKPYPHLVSGSGAFDLVGRPDVGALLAGAVWGRLGAPQLAVRPVDVADEPVSRAAWRFSDAVASWSWQGCDGRPTEAQVFSCDDEVEIVVNGRSTGRRPAGRAAGYMVTMPVVYEHGEITAIGYRDGVESGRTTLRSAGQVQLRLVPETRRLRADGVDLAFVAVELADAAGTVEMLDDDLVEVVVEGPATLAGLGSAAPSTEESFTDARHTTHRGRALLVLRAGSVAGEVVVTATSRRHGAAQVVLPQA